MDGITVAMLMGGVICVLLYQDMRHTEKQGANRARIAALTDERNDLKHAADDLQDEVYSLKDEIAELEDTEFELDISLEEDDLWGPEDDD